MLKKIPKIISPDLMKTLMEMGHGDKIVIADGNFPVHSQGVKVIRADGTSVADLLDVILEYLPLDFHISSPVTLMQVEEKKANRPDVWDKYEKILSRHDYGKEKIGYIDRYDYYTYVKDAYAIIATSDQALYANVCIQKGVCT